MIHSKVPPASQEAAGGTGPCGRKCSSVQAVMVDAPLCAACVSEHSHMQSCSSTSVLDVLPHMQTRS